MTGPRYGMVAAHAAAKREEASVVSRKIVGLQHEQPIIVFLYYVNQSDDHDRVAALRGRGAFDRWEKSGWNVDYGGSVQMRGRDYTGPPLFIFTPPFRSGDEGAKLVEAFRRRDDCALVMDITYPFTVVVPGSVQTMQREIGITDHEITMHYSDPVVRDGIKRQLAEADAVSVSRGEWPVDPHFLKNMRAFNDNTFVLPDVNTPRDVELFSTKLMRAWQSIVRAKRARRSHDDPESTVGG